MPSVNYAVRLRAPYSDLTRLVSHYTTRADAVVCYEHPEKDNVHCHLLLTNVYVTDQTLKDDLKTYGIALKGAGQLSYKTTFKSPDKQVLDITPESIPKYITYMSKGKYDPKYVKGVSDEVICSSKAAWINYPSKVGREDILLGDFNNYMFDYQKKHNIETDKLRVAEVRSCALAFMIKEYNGKINLGCRRDAKMVCDSFLYSHDLITTLDLVLPFEK